MSFNFCNTFRRRLQQCCSFVPTILGDNPPCISADDVRALINSNIRSDSVNSRDACRSSPTVTFLDKASKPLHVNMSTWRSKLQKATSMLSVHCHGIVLLHLYVHPRVSSVPSGHYTSTCRVALFLNHTQHHSHRIYEIPCLLQSLGMFLHSLNKRWPVTAAILEQEEKILVQQHHYQ